MRLEWTGSYRVHIEPTRLGYLCATIDLPGTMVQLGDVYLFAFTERGLWRKINRRLRREERKRRQREGERYVDVDRWEVG